MIFLDKFILFDFMSFYVFFSFHGFYQRRNAIGKAIKRFQDVPYLLTSP